MELAKLGSPATRSASLVLTFLLLVRSLCLASLASLAVAVVAPDRFDFWRPGLLGICPGSSLISKITRRCIPPQRRVSFWVRAFQCWPLANKFKMTP
jgi:hypothetical protein